jgi:hypothetical protein
VTSVNDALLHVPVTRVVHFTPVVNLDGILKDGMVRASEDLAADPDPHHRATDQERYDRQTKMVCCTFEYPNPYYEAIAQRKPEFANYPTWVCLSLKPEVVLTPGTLFHPTNAAYAGGRYGETGGDAMLSMWDSPSPVRGFPRRGSHHPAVPTDLQAEVQIPGPIPLSAVEAIVVESEAQAQELHGWLQLIGAQPERVQWKVAPLLFNKNSLIFALHHGRPITETVVAPTGATP